MLNHWLSRPAFDSGLESEFSKLRTVCLANQMPIWLSDATEVPVVSSFSHRNVDGESTPSDVDGCLLLWSEQGEGWTNLEDPIPDDRRFLFFLVWWGGVRIICVSGWLDMISLSE